VVFNECTLVQNREDAQKLELFLEIPARKISLTALTVFESRDAALRLSAGLLEAAQHIKG
jgi:hypothetical protein